MGIAALHPSYRVAFAHRHFEEYSVPEVADSTGLQPAGHFDYYPLPVARIIRETDDACSLVFDIPPQLLALFSYRAGQYLTLRANVNGEQVDRCYSLA